MSTQGKMTACVLHGIRDLRVEEVDIPRPGEGQALLRIHAAGICGSDVERVYTKGTYHYPTIIGHEFAGEVVDASDGEREWIGKRVTAFPLIPCMECDPCLDGDYAHCGHYDYYGSRRDGGFAEYLAVNTWNLLTLPDGVSYQSGAMFEPASVAVSALRLAGDLAGKSIAIFGVGTIGLIMAMVARQWGCRSVILVARSREKSEFAKALGFGDALDSSEVDALGEIERITGNGADIAVEGCGKAETFSMAVRATAPSETVVCLGNPVDDMGLSRDDYWGILRKGLTLKGTWNSSFKTSGNAWDTVREMTESGSLRLEGLITGVYRFDQANEAFEDLHGNNNGCIHVKSMFVS